MLQQQRQQPGETVIYRTEPGLRDIQNKRISSVGKMYVGSPQRYGGVEHEAITLKLRVFDQYCQDAGLAPHERHLAFHHILKG